MLFSCSLWAQDPWQEGVHYKDLSPEQAQVTTQGPVQVQHWFWYGCASCTVFARQLPDLKAPDLSWQALPAQLRPNWYFHAKAYYVASTQANAPQLEQALFQTLNEDSTALADQDAVLDWFVARGLSRDEVHHQMTSPLLNQKLKADLALQQKWQIRGVPALVIDNRYLVDAGMVHSLEEFLSVTQFLLQQARQNRAQFPEQATDSDASSEKHFSGLIP